MTLHWTAPRTTVFRDAYLDWSRLLGKRMEALPPVAPDRGDHFEPIFVRLIPGEAAQAARRALLAGVARAGALLMDPHETTRLQSRIDTPQSLDGLPDEYALYRRVGTPDSDFATLFDVLDTGVPLHLRRANAPSGQDSLPARNAPRGAPIMAIIDDGIGFLNSRFCRRNRNGHLRSRFHAVWLQALESRSDTGGVLAGDVLDYKEIEALFDQPEGDAYAALNARVNGPMTRPATGFMTSHGTHVLDLAAGADPLDSEDPVRSWPLLGVQLPSETIDDTSGMWFESYMIQGLRWILMQAREINAQAPVIVNLSLGISAGPKNGSRFVEHQMAREARLWEEVTGQPVRLVWSFGNMHRGDLIAKWDLPQDKQQRPAEMALTCRIQPDDMTASFVEIRTRRLPIDGITVHLTAPNGTTSGPVALAPGETISLEDGSDAVARLYHQPARRYDATVEEPAHYVLALAPTRARKTAEPVAPAGAWRIGVQYEGDAEAQVLLQIQRDDALGGSQLRGRQAYFDDPKGYGWDTSGASYNAPQTGCPIALDGTHNALATAPARQVFSVGAAASSGRAAGPDVRNFAPAYYTGAGATWSVDGPTVSTLVDHGPFGLGSRAAGTLTGSTRRLGGTSAAAGRLSRALGLSASLIAHNATRPETTQLDDLNRAMLDIFVVPEAVQNRLGGQVVVVPDSGLSL